MKFLTWHKFTGMVIFVWGQQMACKTVRVLQRPNGYIKWIARRIDDALKGTLRKILNIKWGQPVGNIQCVVEEPLEVSIVSVFMVVSFQDLFENKSTKNLQSQIKEMQRRFKSEIVTANDCCINTDLCRLCMLLGQCNYRSKGESDTNSHYPPLHCFFIDYSVSVNLIYTSALSSALKFRFLLFLFAN